MYSSVVCYYYNTFHWTWGVTSSSLVLECSKFLNNLFSLSYKNLRTTREYHKFSILITITTYFSRLQQPSSALTLKALKLEKKKSHIMFNETCYNYSIFCQTVKFLAVWWFFCLKYKYYPDAATVSFNYVFMAANLHSNKL